ncbi:elongation factor G [Planctomycetota bacterium]
MADYTVKDIRTFVLAGHGKCGKTSLADNMLFTAGEVTRLGNVEEGNSVSDYMDEEKKRQISISSSILHCTHKEKIFNIVDSPGYTDFIGDSIAALSAIDFAVLVIDASGGVQVNTRKVWEIVQEYNLPLIIVVNKMDAEHLQVPEIIEKIQKGINSKCVPLNYPAGTGGDFTAVNNLLDKSLDLEGNAADLQNALFENIIEGDEELLMRYLDDEEIEISELIDLLKKAISEKSVIPILFTSAVKSVGVKECMDFIADFGIAPDEGPVRPIYKETEKKPEKDESEDAEEQEPAVLKEEVEYAVSPDESFKGRIFKVVTDPYVGKLCFLRVFSGTAKEGLTVASSSSRRNLNLTQLLRVQGEKQEPIDKGIPGDIVAVAKIEELQVGDTLLGKGAEALKYADIEFPEPMVSLAIFSKKRGDEQKIGPALKTFANEDILFNMTMNKDTHEMVISGMGNLHLESILSRMKERFNLEVDTQLPKINYKETITGRADVNYKHKKQTGGHGQYGEVYIKVESLERGSGFEFVDAIVGGSIPRQYIPAVEKGVMEIMAKGIYAGFTVVDVKVTVYDGSFHAVDSSEMAFKTASSKAFKNGFMRAKPVLLEPIHNVEIIIPAKFMGDITGDINSRRGQMLGVDSAGEMQVIKAIIPESELQTYSTELRSATGGEGSFTKVFSHYEVVPDNFAQQIIKKYKKEEEEDE